VAERRDLDVAQLKKALKSAAGPYCAIRPTRDESGDFTISYPVGSRQVEIFDSRSLPTVAGVLKDRSSANTSVDPEAIADLSADAALTISRTMLRHDAPRFPDKDIQAVVYDVLRDFVVVCVSCLSRYRRHYVPISCLVDTQIGEALSAQDRSLLVKIFRASLGLGSYPDRPGYPRLTAVPRAFIASPLTNLDEKDHQVVLGKARSVRRLLNGLGITVVAPSPDLTPSRTTDESADDLYGLERLLISASDLVVAVGAEHDSWGISRTVAWAEASGCITIILSERRILSRVLDGTSHHTYRPEIETEPESQAASLMSLINEMLPLIRRHARDRIDVCARLRKPVAEARRRLERLEEKAFEESFLTRKRALELLSDPVMLYHASHIEGSMLQQLLGDRLDPVLRALGRATNAPGERAGAQGMNGLSPQSFANLRSVTQAEGWTDTEVLKLISESLRTPAGVGYAFRNRPVSGGDWKQLHRRIYGSSR
jgi:hypothetical protein